MGMSGSGNRGGVSEINVTPLIDVLLVLLIIFMVIVPVTPSGLRAAIPQPARTDQPQIELARTIVVQVRSGASGEPAYKINGEDFTKIALEPKLAEIYAARQDKAMFLKADASLEYSIVAEVIDSSRRAGVEQVGVMTPRFETSK